LLLVIANCASRLHTDAMPRKLIKRFIPDHQTIREQKCLRFLGTCLHNPALWHLNRHSVAGAFFVGMVCAFVPIPFQMVLAAILAILFQVNIPVSVALVWLTNPLTMPPLFYAAYEVGRWILGTPDSGGTFKFEPSWQWMVHMFSSSWEPFLLGCFVTGMVLGIISYIGIHLLWRAHVIYRWRNRHSKAVPVTPCETGSKAARNMTPNSHSRPNSIHL
jgi:uncharacterized protein